MKGRSAVRVTALFFTSLVGLESFGGAGRALAGTPDATASAVATAVPVASALPKPPITNAEDLRAYLAAHQGEVTPFDAFGPAAKADFIAGIRFSPYGFPNLNYIALEDQLTDPQRIAILALFGMQREIADYRPAKELSPKDREKARRIAELIGNRGTAPDRIERSYAAFEHAATPPGLSDLAIQSVIRRNYRERFSAYQRPAILRDLGDADLLDIYRATLESVDYSHDPSDARALLADFWALQHRNLTTPRDEDNVLDRLLSSRLFGEAKTFATQHPELGATVPDFKDTTIGSGSGPTELVISHDAKGLIRRSFDLSKPAQVIVVSSPFCHFCQGAVRDIAAVPALEQRMRRYSRWLADQDGSIGLLPLQKWNVAHPAEKMTLVYRETEWPMIDSWATPTFYFFKKKTLVAKMTGWPPEGRVAQLERALDDIGAN